MLNHTDYVLGAGADNRIALGALLEIVTAVANIATAVVFYPVLKRQNQAVALGYVASRTAESVLILVGVLAVMSVVTLRQDIGGAGAANAATLTIAGRSLVALKDWTFLLGPAFGAGIGTGVLLGYLMYSSGLMPRPLTLLGLIGGPISAAGAIAVLFGAWDQTSSVQLILTIGEILWELSVTLWLIIKGFQPSPITAAYDQERGWDQPREAQLALQR